MTEDQERTLAELLRLLVGVEGLPFEGGSAALRGNVAQSTDTILAKWRSSAWVLGGFAVMLMLGCLGLALMFVRELLLRQKVSARLTEAEHDLRTTLDNVPSMIAYWDAGMHNRFANRAALEEFGTYPAPVRGRHISELYQQSERNAHQSAPMERIFTAGMREFLKLRERRVGDPGALLDGARRAMRASFQRELDVIESNLSFLATVGSVSPYVGLFGTVWGVMHAFTGFANMEQITLAINEISDMATQISSAAEEQRAVTDEVGRNIQATKDVSDELSHAANNANTLASELKKIAGRINEQVGNFHV